MKKQALIIGVTKGIGLVIVVALSTNDKYSDIY